MAELNDTQLFAQKEQTLRIAVVTTLVSLIPTAYAAIRSNSIILYTDLLRCSVEFLAIYISWFVLKRIGAPGKSRFDYGHGKLERFSSLLVAFALLITFVMVVIAAVHRALSPKEVDGVLFGFVFALMSVVGNTYMWLRYRVLNKQSRSPLIEAQSRLFRAKTFATLIVVVALLPTLIQAHPRLSFYSDPLGALLLSCFLLHSALGLLSASTTDLLDCSLEESIQLLILRTLVEFESLYTHLEAIRSRRSGGKIFIELFLKFEGSLPLSEVQKRSDLMILSLRNAISGAEIIVVPSV